MISRAHPIACPMAAFSLIALILLTMARPASAVPPNDLCAGAEVIPANQGFPVWTNIRDITGATTNLDPALPDCPTLSEPPTHSVWYTFTPAISHQYTISSCADAPTATTVRDTVMGIYTSANNCVGPLVEIADGCADDSCGPSFHQAAITTSLQAGTKYYIVVLQWGSDILRPDNSCLLYTSPSPRDS